MSYRMSKFTSALIGFIVGVYAAQTYKLPDITELVQSAQGYLENNRRHPPRP